MDNDDVLSGLEPDELMARAMMSEVSNGGYANWTPPTVEELEEILTGYEVKKVLGRGGMGAVYQVFQADLDRLCALKLLPLEVSMVTGFEDRFIQEARAMAKLDHANIVTIFDFGRTSEGHLYYVMEYVDGLDLAALIQSGKIEVGKALAIVNQVCDALEYAHGAGYVHRDVKPANILLDKHGKAKVTDFGLAKIINSEVNHGMTMTGQVMGTVDYMAPEQSTGSEVDHRADIYALGVMLYELLTGSLPKGIFKPPSQTVEVNVKMDEVVIKAMQQQPELRYQRVSEVKSSLKVASEQMSQASAKKLKQENRNVSWYGRLGLMGGGLILAILGVVVFLTLVYVNKEAQNDVRDDDQVVIDRSQWPKLGESYTNAQGEKFIPIEGTEVLFGETELSRKEWQRFIAGSQYKWTASEQSGSHFSLDLPITDVSWHDANAYCKWLTESERESGLISDEMEYRLPTDAEWSVAAGLKDEKVIESAAEKFHQSSFRGMQRPLPDWAKLPVHEDPHWNPTDLSLVENDTFPWGKYWPPKNGDTVAYPEKNHHAFSQYRDYQRIIKRPIKEAQWESGASDLMDLYHQNFGRNWATDITTFGPMAQSRIAWLYKVGKTKLIYQSGYTYCLIEPSMRIRQADLVAKYVGAELASFKTPQEMVKMAKEYPHGDWSKGVAIGARYKMEGEVLREEWQEWMGYFNDPDKLPGKWIWMHSGEEVARKFWTMLLILKPNHINDTNLQLKRNGWISPKNSAANIPLLIRWEGEKSLEEVEEMALKGYTDLASVIMADFDTIMDKYVRPQHLTVSKRSATAVVVQRAGLSTTGLRGLSGNVSEWVADAMNNPKNSEPVIAWRRGASWKLGVNHRSNLVSSLRISSLCAERSPQVGFRVVLAMKNTEIPTYEAFQYNGHHYALVASKGDWQTTAKRSRLAGGYLLSIESKEEGDRILNRFVNQGEIFLGASRVVTVDSTIQRTGPWTWESGSEFDYYPKRMPHNFSHTEPILKMSLSRNGWYDTAGDSIGRYIIEWE